MKKNAYNLSRLPLVFVVQKWCDFLANYVRNTISDGVQYQIGALGQKELITFYNKYDEKIGSVERIDISNGYLIASAGGKSQRIGLMETPMKTAETIVKMLSSSGKRANVVAHTNKEAFNKENPIELLSQLMKVLNREGLEWSISEIKRHKILKTINDEWEDIRKYRRHASGMPSFPQMRKGDRVPAKAIIMGGNGGDRTKSMFSQEVADGYAFLALRTEQWEDSRRDTYDMYLIDINRRVVVEFYGTHPSWRGFQSWLDHRISKGKFDHLGGMKSAAMRVAKKHLNSL